MTTKSTGGIARRKHGLYIFNMLIEFCPQGHECLSGCGKDHDCPCDEHDHPIVARATFDCKKLNYATWHSRALKAINRGATVSFDGRNEILTVTGDPIIVLATQQDFDQFYQRSYVAPRN